MWTCSKCQATVFEAGDNCPKCGAARETEIASPSAEAEIEVGPVIDETTSPRGGHQLPGIAPKDMPRGNFEQPVANGLVLVFRILAVIGGIWGLAAIAGAFESASAMSHALDRFGASAARQEQATMAGMLSIFTALVSACAAVAFPLGMAEILRLCLLIETNTRTMPSVLARK